MKVTIDLQRCEGNAKCMLAAPEVFAVDDDEKAYLLMEDPPEDLRDKVEEAVRNCPRWAIKAE